MSSKAMVINTIISAIGGALIGGGIVYLTVKKTFEERANNEIADVKRHYALIRKDENVVGMFNDIQAMEYRGVAPESVDKAKRFVESLGYVTPGSPLEYATPDAHLENLSRDNTPLSIFESDIPTDNPGPELDGRYGKPIETEEKDDDGYVAIPGQPYLISVEEFFNTEDEWDKDTLSYYEGDDTLIDEREKIIDDVEKYIGVRHLSMFGQRSNDPNVVYVRNGKISTDFEIILEQGKYSVRVLGMKENELEHSEKRHAPKRMRASD